MGLVWEEELNTKCAGVEVLISFCLGFSMAFQTCDCCMQRIAYGLFRLKSGRCDVIDPPSLGFESNA